MARRTAEHHSQDSAAATSGFGAGSWQEANAMRNSTNAAEYGQAGLGLIFPMYISDAFAARHVELDAERASGGGPEDPGAWGAASIVPGPKEARPPHAKANASPPTSGKLDDTSICGQGSDGTRGQDW